jgi:hypothetical protein
MSIVERDRFGRVTQYGQFELSRPVVLVDVDDVPTSTLDDNRVIVLKDHDGVDRPINPPLNGVLPWDAYAVIDENPALPREFQELFALGVTGTLNRLPVQPLSLSSRYVTTQTATDQAWRSKGFRNGPEIPVLDAHRRHSIESYKADEAYFAGVGTQMNFKVRAVLKLIDRIHEEPKDQRRAIFWMDDEIGPAGSPLRQLMQEYADHQDVVLVMPEINTSMGAKPEHMEQLAQLCRRMDLPVMTNYLYDPGQPMLPELKDSLN